MTAKVKNEGPARIFRPWDPATHTHSETSDTKVKKEVPISEPVFNDFNLTVLANDSFAIPPHLRECYVEPLPTTPVPVVPDFLYGMSPTKQMELLPLASGITLDPYSYTMLEEGYHRVLAEEARTKMLSSRKQRPKKFKCPTCDVAFSNNGQLKGHIRLVINALFSSCDLEFFFKFVFIFKILLAIVSKILNRNFYFTEFTRVKDRSNVMSPTVIKLLPGTKS